MTKLYSYAAESHVGHHRAHNEDSYAVFSCALGEVFVVCDGMGGHAAGDIAAQIAVERIKAFLAGADKRYKPSYWLRRALHYAHAAIFQAGHGHYGAPSMGTTAVVLLLTPAGEAWWAHTGDSRLYLLREGTLYQLTHDHSYVSLLVDTGHISPEAAFGHPQSNQLLFSLGVTQSFTLVEASTFPLPVQKNDLFLLCSDGLSGLVPEEEIRQRLAERKPLADKVRLLIQSALDAGGYDNITAVLVACERAGAKLEPSLPTPKVILAGILLILAGFLAGWAMHIVVGMPSVSVLPLPRDTLLRQDSSVANPSPKGPAPIEDISPAEEVRFSSSASPSVRRSQPKPSPKKDTLPKGSVRVDTLEVPPARDTVRE
ncbi:MAG: hypothetical protein KatS3mg025_0588 [Bacteroidia bacterium]|jgi:serine/threonine protein phosphatase PrpC|nr:MAG: hypothetical protein KatS3mg025_0588 [Bacteroidia bacterium]